MVSKWIAEQLQKEHSKPFFLACGIYRPHEPWFVPKKYFDPFPIEEIQLPPGYKADDLDDLPPAGKERGPNRYFPHIQEQGQWKQGIQGYLASIAFADAMVGRVISALEEGPNRDNTIVVLWSDHGWHLGEKEHWQKYTGWRVCTRVPLIIRAPKGTPGLPNGTTAGIRCTAPVNLLSLYPTLTQLAGLPAKESNDGPSLVPLLQDADAAWDHVSMTYIGKPGNYAMSGQRWRYIEYENGDAELYDIESDRYEWKNLATNSTHAHQVARMKKHVPATFAKYIPASVESLPELEWHSLINDSIVPPSNQAGNKFDVVFSNTGEIPIKMYWLTNTGKQMPQGTLQAGWRKPYKTMPGTVWLATDEEEQPLGYFVVGDRTAQAVIPDKD